MTALVVATAGHVDHGKSTLVRCLSGMDPDRLAEEKARGLTIDLGFAWMTLPSGSEVAFVDVPGHVRFLKNMLAGAGAVDHCLFVVDACEGWKPQSEEHLRILELLGHVRGILVLTKVASLGDDERELARLEVAERVAGSFLADAPLVEVDALAGIGLDELERALDEMVRQAPSAAEGGRARLWVDRSFSVQGSGTVVTGTLAGGSISVGDRLEAVPGPGPSHRPLPVRVRGLQSHRRGETVAFGGRVAVNVSGADLRQLQRGQALVAPGHFEPTLMFDGSLRVLGALGHDVSRRGAYSAYVGSGEHAVRLRLLGRPSLAPGEEGLVRVHLPVPLPLTPGDRFVLREAGRSETVGGGEVLDVAPVLPASRAAPDRSLDRVVRERGIVDAALLERLSGVPRAADLAGRWVADPTARSAAEARLRSRVDEAGALGLELALLDEVERALVAELPDVAVVGGRAVIRGAAAVAATFGSHPYLEALRAAPYRPPAPDELGVDRRELRELVRQGSVIGSGGCYFAATALDEAASVVAEMLGEEPEGVTASAIRERLGTSRKYVLALLAHLDGTGVTRRRGELRVAGPRLPRVTCSPASDSLPATPAASP